MNFIESVILMLALASVSQITRSKSIVKRHASECHKSHSHMYQWVAHISNGDKKCKGIWISESHILTTAHCFIEPREHGLREPRRPCDRLSGYNIRNTNGDSGPIHANNITWHKDYTSASNNLYRNDMAIVEADTLRNKGYSRCQYSSDFTTSSSDKCWIYDGVGETIEMTIHDCPRNEIQDSDLICANSKRELQKGESGNALICVDENARHYVKGLVSMKHTTKKYIVFTSVNDDLSSFEGRSCNL